MPKAQQQRGSRKPNWTKEEEEALLDAIEPQYRTLFGELSHLVSQDVRDGIWGIIHKKVIAANLYNVKRDLKSIKKKWKDMKFRTKVKVSKLLKEHGVRLFDGGEDDFLAMLEEKMGGAVLPAELRLARLIGKNALMRFGDPDAPFLPVVFDAIEASGVLSARAPAKRNPSRSVDDVLEPETILIEVNETYDNKDCLTGSKLPAHCNGFSAVGNGDTVVKREARRRRIDQVLSAGHVPAGNGQPTTETKLLATVSCMKDELAGIRREMAALKDCLVELVALKKMQLGIEGYQPMSNE